jgi:hypothetical protein
MSVTLQTPYNVSTGNGATTVFPYQFLLLSASDLTVYVDGSLKTLTADYSVSNVGAVGGGNVTFVVAPGNGLQVSLVRAMRQERLTDYQQLGDFLTAVVNPDFDRAILLAQDELVQLQRSIRVPAWEPSAATTLPAAAARANTYITFDSSGNLSLAASLPSGTLSQASIGAFLYPRTAAEIAAGVTPVAYWYAPGVRARYASLSDCIAVSATHQAVLSVSESISAVITLPSGAMIIGYDRPTITQTTAGVPVFAGANLTGCTITGVNFVGASASTVPGVGYGGYAAANTGLVTVAIATDVRITDCGFSTFYNCLSVMQCTRLWVNRNKCDTFLTNGILAARSTSFAIEDNDITNCTQAGGVVAYGVQCTGDQAGGFTSAYNSISFNRIRGIPSWDGIGTHDIDGLRVIGNDIRNVRQGVDIGHLVSTNFVQNITIANNYIEGATTDTWATVPAQMGGIIIEGFDATHRVLGATITGNLIRGFWNVAGLVGGGLGAACIVVSHADDTNISGNAITGCGTAATPQATGIYATGTCNRLSITGNTLQAGNFNRGGIRTNALTADALTVVGNQGIYTTTSCPHVNIISSTITNLNVNSNPTNSTVPYLESSTTTTNTSNATLAGSGNAATAVSNNSTIPTAFGFVKCTVGAASTGNILTAGIAPAQECVIINTNGSNSITMAAAGTSNVADGVACVIAANTHKRFVWNDGTSLWYHS